MNQQLAISFSASYVGSQAWERQLEALNAAVAHLGAKEVAWELKIDGPRLSDALKERNQKVWHPLWTHVVKAMLSAQHDEIAADLLRAIVDADVAATPFAISDDVEQTPEEENVQLRRSLMKFGDAGKAEIDRIKKRGKR